MSDNLSKYDQVFRDVLGLEQSELNYSLLYQSVPSWDSVGHMEIVSRIEESFDIHLEMDDIIDFSSYEVGKKIMSKYGFDLEG